MLGRTMYNGITDTKDMEVHEQSNKIKDLTASLEDYEGTISQFRDLVLQLQSLVLPFGFLVKY